MFLQPGQNFTIVRQLGMPGDTTTYYVQGVVKNSTTGVVIKTINLTDKGGQRFEGNFQLPADTLGTGLHIDITTSVYTDSGHIIYSQLYTIDNAVYIIRDTSRWGVGGGNSSGSSTDYKIIKKLLDEAVASIVIPIMPEIKETDLTGILKSLKSLEKKLIDVISSSTIPLNGQILTLEKGLHEKIEEVSSVIKNRAEFKETDLSPLVDKMEEHKENVITHVATHFKFVKDEIQRNKDDIFNEIKNHVEEIDESDKLIDELVAVAQKAKGKNRIAIKKEKESVPTPDDWLEIINEIYPQ